MAQNKDLLYRQRIPQEEAHQVPDFKPYLSSHFSGELSNPSTPKWICLTDAELYPMGFAILPDHSCGTTALHW